MDSSLLTRHKEFLDCIVHVVLTAQHTHPGQVLSVGSEDTDDHPPGSAPMMLAEALSLFEQSYIEHHHLKTDELAQLLRLAVQEGYDFMFMHSNNSHYEQRPYATLQMQVQGYLVMYNNLGTHARMSASKGFDHVLLRSA